VNVLSLFDGISCGQLALNKANVPYAQYFASEIDQHAIKVTQHNYPNTIQLGSVINVHAANLPQIDLLIGGSPCFVAGTKVITKTSIKNIEDVVVGDYVLTHTNTFHRVLAIGAKYSDTMLLKAQGMKPTITTNEHPYYVRTMTRKWDNSKRTTYRHFSEPTWKPVSELSKGDFIGMPRLRTSENVYNLTHEECWVLGRYIADGHTRKDFRVSEDRPNDRQWQLILSIGSHKLDVLKNSIHTLHYSAYPHSKSVTRVVFSNKRLVEIAESECGHGAENKHISMNLLNLPNDLLRSLLDGYLSGDGCNKTTHHTATSISESLILNLNLALLKVYGVNSSYEYTKRPPKKYIEGRLINQNDSYTTSFRFDMKPQSNSILLDDIMWLPVKSTENTSRELVYNLEVETDNSYTANNIIVHNCQGFSFSGKQLNFNDPRSALFFEYVRLLKECNPKYFLLENVVMKKEYEQVITNYLGVNPIMINSALVSAQTRKRLYWTNIPNISQPEDKNITWKDVREHDDNSNTYIHSKSSVLKLSNTQAVASMRGRCIINGKRVDGKMKTAGLTKQYIEFRYDGKSNCITTVQKDNVIVPYTLTERIPTDDFYYRYMSPIECERLQTVPDNYTNCVSKTNRIKQLGNGWTVDVIAHIFKNLPKGTV
jgi:site-specific DNA-cytosine methylase